MSKKFPCSWVIRVLCPHKKTRNFALLSQCFECSHYREFLRDMAEEDEKVMDDIDRERRELSEVRKGL